MLINAADPWTQYPVEVASANQSLTFTPCNGRILCTFHDFDEYYHCDWVACHKQCQVESNPTAFVKPLSRERLCAYNERTGLDTCDFNVLTLDDLLDQDVAQITCPDGLPPSVDTTGRAIDLSVATSFTTMNVVVQIGCEQDLPCSALYLLDRGSQSYGTVYPVTLPATRLRVKAFGSNLPERMYYAQWSVHLGDGPAIDLIQIDAQWLEISVPSDAPSIQLYASANYEPLPPEPEPPRDPQPITTSSFGVSNYCSGGANVLLSTPREPDFDILSANAGAGYSGGFIYSDDPRMVFTSLSRQMCAVVERTGARDCGTDVFVASDLREGDDMRLECPDNGPPRPVADVNIPVSISTTQSSPNLLIQVGCEPGGYCLSYTHDYNAYRGFNYPVLEPMARFRIRIFGARLMFARWRLGFSQGPKELYVQPKGQWFNIVVPSDATSVEIEGEGFEMLD